MARRACLAICLSCAGWPAVASPQAPVTPSQTTDGSAGTAVLGAPAAAMEADEHAAQEPTRLRLHATILAAGAAVLVVSGAIEGRLAPAACRWCDLKADGTNGLNTFDRHIRDLWRWNRRGPADALSAGLAFGMVPAAAVGLNVWSARQAGVASNIKADTLVVCEAVVLAADATQAVKFLTARQRPDAHARALGQAPPGPADSGDNLSFPSDHVASAFAIAVSGASVASLRRYAHADWIWRLALPAAAAVGYFRIASDRHYAMDVLAGAALGSAIGWAVPRLVFSERPGRAGRSSGVRIEPLLTGSFAGLRCSW